jgi:hypothetical protein
MEGKKMSTSFAVPTIWLDETNNFEDCYVRFKNFLELFEKQQNKT